MYTSAQFQNPPHSKNFKAFSTRSFRTQFTNKVLSTVSLQLAFTVLFVTLIPQVKLLNSLSHSLSLLWLLGSLSTFIAISCSRKLARKTPKNYLILGVFTICETMLLNNFLSQVSAELKSAALLITLFIVVGGYAVARFSNYNFMSPKFIAFFTLSQFFFFIISSFMFQLNSLLVI